MSFPDSSSISERRPAEKKPEPVPEKKQKATTAAPRRNPNKKEIRRDLEQGVMKRLENLGVKPVSCYVNTAEEPLHNTPSNQKYSIKFFLPCTSATESSQEQGARFHPD